MTNPNSLIDQHVRFYMSFHPANVSFIGYNNVDPANWSDTINNSTLFGAVANGAIDAYRKILNKPLPHNKIASLKLNGETNSFYLANLIPAVIS